MNDAVSDFASMQNPSGKSSPYSVVLGHQLQEHTSYNKYDNYEQEGGSYNVKNITNKFNFDNYNYEGKYDAYDNKYGK